MLGKMAAKVAWVGRTASMVFGLALVLGLVFGAATMALGANGGNLILGRTNLATTLTELRASVQGSTMKVQNTNPDLNDSALSLQVQSGEAPMRVNSSGKVANLNVDEVDYESFECPARTMFFHEGVCIEMAKRGPANFGAADSDCLDEGRRLPTVAELQTFRNREYLIAGINIIDFNSPELTSEYLDNGRDFFVKIVNPNDGGVDQRLFNVPLAYRCAVHAS